MGNVTLAMPCGNVAFVRAYVIGFTVHAPCTGLRWNGQAVEFDVAPNDLWHFGVSDEFYPASSNCYTLDHVFDASDCFHYTGGVPIPAFVNIGLVYRPGDFNPRIGFNCLGAQDASQHIELAPLTDYWRQFS